MLSLDENALLTRVGAGTPMGETLRRYWMPALLSDEIVPDGAPVRVKLLGEELVAFRDSEGRVGLLGEFCPHRGASLLYARNEESGLRCIYHGWKYDVAGLTIETPNESGTRMWEGRLKHLSYPTHEAGGVVWAYLGPEDRQPAFPTFPWLMRQHVTVVKVLLDCSYLQSLEGGIDSSHLSFLHRSSIEAAFGPLAVRDASPRLELQDMPYGFRYAALRNGKEGELYVRITPVISPFMTVVPFQLDRPQAAHVWVPIDDEHNFIFTFNWMHEDGPLPSGRGSQGYEMAGRFTKLRTRANQHLQDREAMKTDSWSGVKLIPDQDAEVQESMKPIVDRSQEHLGQADLAVVHARALLLASVRAVQEGRDPVGIGIDFPTDQICSVVAEVTASTPWRELGLPVQTASAAGRELATEQNRAIHGSPATPGPCAPPHDDEERRMTETLEAASPALYEIVPEGTPIDRIAGGFGFTEGPVWRGDELLFSDIRNNRIVRWRQRCEGPEVTTFSLGYSNGLTIDRQSMVIAAEHGGRKISRVGPDGARTTLVDRYQGLRLNSPNDVVVKSDGSIYFTDPPYATNARIVRNQGWWSQKLPGKQLDVNGVYRLAPDGTLTLVADDFALPNGLAFSPDEQTLYVDDSRHGHIRAFDVSGDGSLANSRVILKMDSTDDGVADGMKVDAEGTIYCTGPGGIWVCRPNGEFLGRIVVPEIPSNVAWGDDWCTLFVTARTSVYRIRTKTQGIPVP